ncbi:MAG: hypothetical protein Q8906_03625 [Bacillota bacterium]|nr:hypothetical protein [Bacillota bacterium]
MKKIYTIIMISLMLFATAGLAPRAAHAEELTYLFCKDYAHLPSITWNGMELKRGQVGFLKVLKPTPLYKPDGKKKISVRTLKPGETFRIYNFLPGMLGIGSGMYIHQDNRVKFETPSKTKLLAVQCQYAPFGPKRDMTDVKTLSFHPIDSAFDESRPILYTINTADHTLHSVNALTKEERILPLSGKPERLFVKNNKIYVTIVNKPHDSYWMKEQQTGAIDMIDALSFKKLKTIQLALDPYDIVVDKKNVIYVSGGSGQSPGMYCINTETGVQYYDWWMSEKSALEFSADETMLYVYDMRKGLSKSFFRYPIHDGKVDYPLNKTTDMPFRQVLSFIQVSPDGKYIFDNTGQYYNRDFLYIDDLKSPLSSSPYDAITFDQSHNRFYVAWGRNIYEYNYSSFQITKTLYPFWNVEKMWIQNGKLFTLTVDSNKKGHIETLSI